MSHHQKIILRFIVARETHTYVTSESYVSGGGVTTVEVGHV